MSFRPWLWVLQTSYIQINRGDQLVFDGRSNESHRVHLGTSLNRIGKKPNERQLPCGSPDRYSEGSENNASVTCEGTSGFEMFRCCTTSLACGSGTVVCTRRVGTHINSLCYYNSGISLAGTGECELRMGRRRPAMRWIQFSSGLGTLHTGAFSKHAACDKHVHSRVSFASY